MMKYKKIHIIGGPGSGKTFTASKIEYQYSIKSYNLDDIFWDNQSENYNQKSDPETRNKELVLITSNNSWIIEGVYYAWLKPSFENADVVFILTPNVWLRDFRILSRFLKRMVYKHHRKESLFDLIDLIKWNHKYEKVNIHDARKHICQISNNIKECKNYSEVIKILNFNNQ